MAVSTQTDKLFGTITQSIVLPIQECPGCGTRVDVAKYEPLQQIACPVCEKRFVVEGYMDRFALKGICGRGGTGVVYQAHDPHLGRLVALKVVRQDKSQDQEVLSQLLAEAGITASVKHPNVVRVYSVGTFSDRFFMAMELVGGGTLDDLLTKHGKLPEARVLDIAIQIASGLQAAQQSGLVHRDIKPGNILFADVHTAKLADFGLAIFEQHAAPSGEIWGTPYYMPPERLEGVAEDFRADIYSLGATLFHALTGRPPFEAADGAQVALKRLHHAAPSVLTYAPKTSNATAFVLKKMLERDPGIRFQSYQELIDSLTFARNELGQKPAAKARVVVSDKEDTSAGMWITVGSIGLLAALGVGAFFMFRNPEPKIVQPAEDRPANTATALAATVPSPAPAVTSAIPAKRALLVEGTYIITNRKTNKVLDCANTGYWSGAKVLLYHRAAGINQRLFLRNDANGNSRLIFFHSFKSLDVKAGSSEDSAPITQWDTNSGNGQVWTIRSVQGGWYSITSLASGKVLTAVTEADGSDGVAQRADVASHEQQWRFELIDSLPEGLEGIDPVVSPVMKEPAPVAFRPLTTPPDRRFVLLDIASAATSDTRGKIYNPNPNAGYVPAMRGKLEVSGVPFEILDPAKTASGKDTITLKGGLEYPRSTYPRKVEIPVGGIPLRALHFVGGTGGWGYPYGGMLGTVAAKIVVFHPSGKTQHIILRNGMEFCDHITRRDKKASTSASASIEGLAPAGQNLRYFSKALDSNEPVDKIAIESFDNHIAPTFFAITGQR